MDRTPRVYRIQELSRITGIPRRTIHFYLNSGLLHEPFKTGRTMSYYDEAHQGKLEYIKALKQEGLPLLAIKQRIQERERNGDGFGRRAHESFGKKQDQSLAAPRNTQGKKTREMIVEVGCRLFMEKGYHRTSVNEIINELGQGKGSFYHFFTNKKELFLECVPLIFNNLFTENSEKIQETKDPAERLKIRLNTWFPVRRELNTILRLCNEAVEDEDPKLHEFGRRIIRSIYRPVQSDIEQGIKSGVFKKVDARVAAFLIIGALAGLDFFESAEPGNSKETLNQAIWDLAASILIKDNDIGRNIN